MFIVQDQDRLKPDPVVLGADFFLRTKLDDGLHCRDTAFEDFLHGGLADDVVDLSAAEVEVRRQLVSLLCGKDRELVLPDVLLRFHARFVQAYLEEETAFESFVKILFKVGGRDQYAVELLHLFQQDVLDGVLRLVDA